METKDRKIIFMIGSPGAGKDTQANFLAKKTGFYKFVTSHEGWNYINAHQDNPFVVEQGENYKKGLLFDAKWLVESVHKSRVKDIFESGYKGIIFAGSPRTLFEARELSKILSEMVGKDNIITLVLEIPEDELLKRSAERLVCDKNESHFYSTRLDGFKLGDSCPECGGMLVKRQDEKSIKTRVEQYKKKTLPAVEYLKDGGYNVVDIDGMPPVDEVAKSIDKYLEKFLQ